MCWSFHKYFLNLVANYEFMITGKTVRIIRIMKGYKQSTIAKYLGISQPAYSKLENCINVNTEKCLCLSRLFNYSLEELIYINEKVIKNDEIVIVEKYK